MPVTKEQAAVIEAAICSEENVYFIGPHGSRVSFASQQRRVLNLIWSLYADDRLARSAPIKVAVVGAGIAGVTAVAALRALDLRVTLIEQHGHAMSLQETSGHRTIHPTINFWPQENLEWTTKLPFFDWFAGTAKDIIGLLSQEWTEGTIGDCVPLFNTHVKKIEYDPDEEKVRIITATGDRLFDLVFVATGFGIERNCKDKLQTTYWNGDDVHKLVTSDKRVLVSGTGDGGVIDALRLVYRRFMEDEIALLYLLGINTEGFQQRVKRIETKGNRIKDLEKRAAYYADEYSKLAADRAPNDQKLLQPATEMHRPQPGREPKVVLMGKRKHPFEISSAPIHRLILAHTFNEGWLGYRQGSLDRDEAAGTFFYTKDGIRHEVTEDVVIVRHGAELPVKDLIGEDGAKDLETSQSSYGDFIHMLGMDTKFFDDVRRDRAYSPNCYSLADQRLELAKLFVDKRFGGWVDIHFVDEDVANFYASPLEGTKFSAKYGRRPEAIFNVEIKWGQKKAPQLDTRVGSGR